MKKIKIREMNKWAYWSFSWFGFIWIFIAMYMSLTKPIGWFGAIYFLPMCSNYLMNLFKPDGKTGVGEKVAFAFEGIYLGIKCYWSYIILLGVSFYLWWYGFSTWNIPIMFIGGGLPLLLLGLKRNGICYGHI